MSYPEPYQQPAAPGFPAPNPGQYPPPYPPFMVVAPPSSGAATASMVLGILGLVLGWCTLGIPCLIAVFLGHVGLRETRGGLKSGHGQAVAGLVMGYLALVPAILLFFGFVVSAITGGAHHTPLPTP